MLITVHQRTA